MPTYFRRDDRVVNGLGYAIPNNAVTYYSQPGLALATIYDGPTGATIISNPQFTDGLGQTAVYMLPGEYTIVYSGPQIQTETFPDQLVGGSGGSGGGATPFAGFPLGVIDGVNRTFTYSVAGSPISIEVFLNVPKVPTVGFNYAWAGGVLTITYLEFAPQTGDTLYVQGWY